MSLAGLYGLFLSNLPLHSLLVPCSTDHLLCWNLWVHCELAACNWSFFSYLTLTSIKRTQPLKAEQYSLRLCSIQSCRKGLGHYNKRLRQAFDIILTDPIIHEGYEKQRSLEQWAKIWKMCNLGKLHIVCLQIAEIFTSLCAGLFWPLRSEQKNFKNVDFLQNYFFVQVLHL